MKPRQRTPTRTRRVQRALTLIELMVVVVVAAVLLVLVAPSFRDLILNQRLKSIHAQLVTDLQFARAEAVARGVLVSVRVQPAGSGGTMSCYIILTDSELDITKLPSNRCDCSEPAESRCPLPGVTTEIRTVQIPVSQGVSFSLPTDQLDHFSFNLVTGGMQLSYTETGLPLGGDFAVNSSINSTRQIRSIVGVAGRITACRPSGSVIGEQPCAP